MEKKFVNGNIDIREQIDNLVGYMPSGSTESKVLFDSLGNYLDTMAFYIESLDLYRDSLELAEKANVGFTAMLKQLNQFDLITDESSNSAQLIAYFIYRETVDEILRKRGEKNERN